MLQTSSVLLGALVVLLLSGCTTVQPEPQPTNTVGSAQQSLDAGVVLSSSCSGCHAAGNTRIKSLSGYKSLELQRLLVSYRDDVTGTTAMHRMARGFSDADISLIAAELGE